MLPGAHQRLQDVVVRPTGVPHEGELRVTRDVVFIVGFLFVSRDRKRAKVLFFDGTGLCLLSKRLDKGRFAAVYERAKEGVLQMTPSELQLFIEGSDAVGRVELSPPLLTLSDLTPRWPGKKSLRPEKLEHVMNFLIWVTSNKT